MANTMRIGFNLTNWDEMRTLLTDLPPAMEERVMEKAMEAAARPIVQIAKSLTPRRTGALRRSIVAVVKRYPGKGKIVGIIGPDKGYYISGRRVKVGASNRGADRPASYAHLVEFGHYSATATGVSGRVAKGTQRVKAKKNPKPKFVERSYVLPRPFLRPAVLMGKGPAHEKLAEGVRNGLQREISRLSRKLKKVRNPI